MNVEKDLGKYMIDRFFHGDTGKLKEDESLFETGIIDSLGVLQLIAFIEERFGVQVEDEELIPENFDSFNKIKEFVENKLVIANK